MCFCETNRIQNDVIFNVTPYADGGYERAAQKKNPVCLERNGARGGVARAMSCPRFRRSGGCRNRDRNVAPTRMEGEVDGDFTVWRWCWKVQCGNGILLYSRLT
jgi:hypothetical protein